MLIHGGLNLLNSNMNKFNQIAFIGVPRCGTTSLLASISSPKNLKNNIILLDHGYCYETNFYDPYKMFWKYHDENIKFKSFEEKEYKALYVIIRNPFDLLKSYYYYTTPMGRGWAGCNDICNFKSWEEFLESYIDPNFEWHLPPMKNSLFSMIYNKKGNLVIDRYFKLENSNNINNFLQYHNYPPLDKYAVSNKKQKLHYTPEQVDKLNKIWERDLKYFNYKYEGQ